MGFNIGLKKPATRSLRPVIPDNARGPRITAAAGDIIHNKNYYVKYGLSHNPLPDLGR